MLALVLNQLVTSTPSQITKIFIYVKLQERMYLEYDGSQLSSYPSPKQGQY